MKFEIFRKISMLLIFFLCGFVLTACGGGGDGGGADGGADGGVGTLSISLTDRSTEEYQAVYVTIARVDVHHENGGSWEPVAEPNQTYNLLELVNGVRETLGITTLDTGHYTQMRLIIGETADDGINILSVSHPHANYIITPDDAMHELKVPSGTNTGLKIVNGFDIIENQTTELLLDFDASRSVVKAGSKDKYLLKPTVKVLDTADYAIVKGTVSDDSVAPLVQAGALVTAQKTEPSNPESTERVVIEAGTLANESGDYALFLAPGDYNLVATQEGFLPGCAAVSLVEDSVTPQDLTVLTGASPGSITVQVAIADPLEDQHVTIDFQLIEVDCGGTDLTTISVKSVNLFADADGEIYVLDLPEGEYQVVASTYKKTTQVEASVTVPAVPAEPPAEPDLSFSF